MNKYPQLEWTCPHCKLLTDIYVEVESPSDYYPDTECEHCGEEIQDEKLYSKILEIASECWVEQ